jgi:hypothetical protein
MHRNTACSHLVLLGGHTTGMLNVQCRYSIDLQAANMTGPCDSWLLDRSNMPSGDWMAPGHNLRNESQGDVRGRHGDCRLRRSNTRVTFRRRWLYGIHARLSPDGARANLKILLTINVRLAHWQRGGRRRQPHSA